LREEGMTVLFVEHDMDMVRDISDWVLVMAQGKLIAEGPPDSVMSDNRVIDAYLGAHHDQTLLEGDAEAQIQQEVAAELAAERGEAVPAQEEER
jgi:branched-chain amino acid transport system ATP-binding protein